MSLILVVQKARSFLRLLLWHICWAYVLLIWGVGVVESVVNISKLPLRLPYLLSVLKRCIPKTLAFAFGLRLRSKTRCFKTCILGRRLPNGKPQERLRFRALRGKTLAFKNASRWFFFAI